MIEIDAASHGGVNRPETCASARSSPVASRYKIYIIDEAHMVTKEGFNALLKVVEEPPPHVKFIFATTEPDKVLGTIRSRTHHYPFRLVPPPVLGAYLTEVCDCEGVAIGDDVIPLVVRAGGGSVRDSLSVLGPTAGRGVQRGRHVPTGDRVAGVHPRQPAGRDGGRDLCRGRRGRVSRPSARSWTPGKTRVASPRTCCTGCATS